MVRPAGWARRLQQWGVIVSQQDHAAHHRGAFDDHYCILSGHWNGVLDRVRFFRALEGVVYVMCGTEPLCWGRDAGLKRESLDMVARVGLRRRERNSGRKEEEC